MEASENGHLAVVQALLASGADIEQRWISGSLSGTALDLATKKGHAQVKATLLKVGRRRTWWRL